MEEGELKCEQCGYRWLARVKAPRKCPNTYCQRSDWSEPKKKKANGLNVGRKAHRLRDNQRKVVA